MLWAAAGDNSTNPLAATLSKNEGYTNRAIALTGSSDDLSTNSDGVQIQPIACNPTSTCPSSVVSCTVMDGPPHALSNGYFALVPEPAAEKLQDKMEDVYGLSQQGKLLCHCEA